MFFSPILERVWDHSETNKPCLPGPDGLEPCLRGHGRRRRLVCSAGPAVAISGVSIALPPLYSFTPLFRKPFGQMGGGGIIALLPSQPIENKGDKAVGTPLMLLELHVLGQMLINPMDRRDFRAKIENSENRKFPKIENFQT